VGATSLARALALTVLALHVATSHGYGYFRDELYYLACSAHPALGYVDSGPLLALLLGPWRAIAGDSLPALRFLPALAAAATVLLTARLVRALGGDGPALLLALAPMMLAPMYVGIFGILTPNALDVVVWAAILLVTVRLLRAPTDRDWALTGALFGVGFLNRHAIVFLAAGLAAGILATRARALFRTRGPWIAAAIAAAIALPHLAWQATHGWPTLEFLAHARATKMLAQSPVAFLGEQVLVLDPLAAPVWMTGLAALWRRDGGRLRALVWAYGVILVLMITGGGKAYYLTPFYPVLFAAGAIAIAARSAALARTLTVAVLLSGLALAPFGKALLPERWFMRYALALGIDPRTGIGEGHELDALPQQFADQHGWPELAARVGGVLQRLPPGERARACIVTANFGEAGAIDFFGPAYGLPPARSGHNSYWLWGPGDCDFSTVVTVGFAADAVRALATTVEEADQVECAYCMPYERGPVLIARGPTVPRDVLWARLKRYE
jgi:hypothetical protein